MPDLIKGAKNSSAILQARLRCKKIPNRKFQAIWGHGIYCINAGLLSLLLSANYDGENGEKQPNIVWEKNEALFDKRNDIRGAKKSEGKASHSYRCFSKSLVKHVQQSLVKLF